MKKILLNQGFTATEMIVSVGIITLILGTVIFNYGGFNDRLSLNAAGQEIFEAVREAQIYGASAKQTTTATADFSYAYGIHFDTADQTHYYVFSDKNANYKYDVGNGCGGNNTECVESFTLRNNIKITSICDSVACPPSALNTATFLDILFLRPSTDALVYFSNNTTTVGPVDWGKVTLSSPKGQNQKVAVNLTGQVVIQ